MPSPTTAPLARPAARARFTTTHLLLPLLILLVASSALMRGGDIWLADRLYQAQGSHWQLREAWWTSQLLHRDGKWLSVAGVLATAILWLCSLHLPTWASWRKPLGYLLLSVLVSTGSVSLLKSVSAVDCPWDLLRYGGQRPWLALWQARPAGLPPAVCYPAGHASAGYAWLALYFVARARAPRWQLPALAVGLGAGAVFGIAQQLRGAHFLSHDLASLAVCWFTASGLYLLMLTTRDRHAGTAGARA